MDSIHPITPSGNSLPPVGAPPVDRLARVSRDRDRPARERPEARRREPAKAPEPEDGEDDDGRPRVDVRV
jgi:hypothetical protein